MRNFYDSKNKWCKIKQSIISTVIEIENGKREIKVRRKTVVKSVTDRHLIQLS